MRGTVDRYRTGTGETRWRIRWDEGVDSSGKRRRGSRAGIRTRREAEALLLDVRSRLNLGVTISSDRETVGAYLTRWLDSLRVKPTTLANYESVVRLYIIPELGTVRLRDLQPEHLDALYRRLEASGKAPGVGLAPKSVRHVHTAIRKALQDAYARGHVARNVADLANPPTQRQARSQNAKVKAWTVEQVSTFLVHVADDRLVALWILAASTGLRRGELVGLRWSAIDLDEGTLRVERTVTEAAGRVVSSDSAKTDASERTLALDGETLRVLRTHRRRQTEERLAAGPLWEGLEGDVFTRPDGQPLRPSDVSHVFTRAARAAGLPSIGVHGLRHTYATLSIRAGVPAHIISRRLGHANVGITMTVYAHAFPSDDREAAERAAAFLFGT
jgi:integrase